MVSLPKQDAMRQMQRSRNLQLTRAITWLDISHCGPGCAAARNLRPRWHLWNVSGMQHALGLGQYLHAPMLSNQAAKNRFLSGRPLIEQQTNIHSESFGACGSVGYHELR